MAEIRFSVDQKFMDSLKRDTGEEKATKLTSDALILLKWLVGEVRKGRIIMTTDEEGKDVRKVVMPILEQAKEEAKETA